MVSRIVTGFFSVLEQLKAENSFQTFFRQWFCHLCFFTFKNTYLIPLVSQNSFRFFFKHQNCVYCNRQLEHEINK